MRTSAFRCAKHLSMFRCHGVDGNQPVKPVTALSTSPLVKGDIHGVIAGDTINSWNLGTVASAEKMGVDFVKAAGVGSIAELRRLPADNLMAIASKTPVWYWLVNDGYVLSGNVFDAQKSGAQHDIPILTGITADFGSAIVNPPYGEVLCGSDPQEIWRPCRSISAALSGVHRCRGSRVTTDQPDRWHRLDSQ